MSIETGTPDTRTDHSRPLALLNETIVVLIPALLLLGGIAALGWEPTSWLGAIVWGVVAAAAMTGFITVGREVDMTRMNLLDLLGSTIYEPGTSQARTLGFVLHATVGGFLGLTGAYSLALIGWAVTWVSGTVWGAFVSLLALVMLSSVGAVHPKIRAHRQADPGPGATHFGAMTPFGVV
ncbi:MAG: hypothetical protein ABEN55_05040, partial [Bradymonadaceae bacterium]